MTLTPEQREKYGRIGYEAVADRWERILVNMDCGGVHTWEEAADETPDRIEDSIVAAEAVALAAQRDIVERIRKDAEAEPPELTWHHASVLYAWDDNVGDLVAEWLDSYLPAAPSPQEDQ